MKSKTAHGDVIDFEESKEDGLSIEKQYVKNCMKKFDVLLTNQVEHPKQKNAEESIEFRKNGNDMYCSKNHDANKHEKILNLYTQSITYAPNDSEELALAYGNRSALLHHMKEYEQCVKDCEKGIPISNNDFLKAKLLFRKIECLFTIKHESTRKSCEVALETLKNLDMNADMKSKFVEKISEIYKTVKAKTFQSKKASKKVEPTLRIDAQSEAPCASTAIAIKHDQKWGRHVVATRKIEPGEVLVIEKSYLTSINHDGMYTFCDHCAKQTWASVPCESCVYTVYCSEKCKSEAWQISHKHECAVISYLYNLKITEYPFMSEFDGDSGKIYARSLGAALKLVFKAVHEVGGISNLKNELKKVESNKVLRTKGFSDAGILDSEKCRSIYSLTTCHDMLDNTGLAVFVTMACITTYHLARETLLFGEKFKGSPKEMMDNEDIKFISALLLKSSLLLPVNALKFNVHKSNAENRESYGAALHAFCSLFNHSCDPNIVSISSKNNERIVFAKHIIEPGNQLFLCYTGENYTTYSKTFRRSLLKKSFSIDCDCEACTEDWPAQSLYLKDLLERTPTLRAGVAQKLKQLDKLKNQVTTSLRNSDYKYDPALLKNLKRLMKDHAENMTVRSLDYHEFSNFLYKILANGFCISLNYPNTC